MYNDMAQAGIHALAPARNSRYKQNAANTPPVILDHRISLSKCESRIHALALVKARIHTGKS